MADRTASSRTISRKKQIYPVNGHLREYLQEYHREVAIPMDYRDLMRFSESFDLKDRKGMQTFWETVIYPQADTDFIHDGLKRIYSILKAGGDERVHKHLQVERIDFCSFGNSHPFRIKIVNNYNDNYDYFYVKKGDASRVYGLELEHILSPARINYFVSRETVVEEHIAGIPGDKFISGYLSNPESNKVRIAKEFVKFNERCFVRLLGDMRSYNYVFDLTPDFEEVQFRIRAIDFDQQSYEGRKTLYLPQFFKENLPLVQLIMNLLTPETVKQYQKEERTLIARRSISSAHRLQNLLDVMSRDSISTLQKAAQLKHELAAHYQTSAFDKCSSMGDLVRQSINLLEEEIDLK